MKILQVINSLNIGGAEKLIAETVPLMIQGDCKVDVLLLCDTNTQLKKELAAQGIKVWGLTRSVESIYNPLLIFKLIPILKKYDLIHVHLFPTQYWVALAKKMGRLNIPIITTEHNTDNRRRHICILKKLELFIYNAYVNIITISKQAEINQVNYIGLENKTKTILNGVDISKFVDSEPYSKETLGFKGSDYLLMMVAGFRKQKDQDTIIRSLIYLPENVKLLLVGDGERKKLCQSLALDIGVSHRVSFLGIRHDVPNLLKTADIIIMSSHYEGLSLSSIEGMSVSKPFIASDVEGLHEITKGAGVLFEKGNENELASHVIELMENKKFYNQISASCLERAKEYDVHSMVDQLLTTYKEVTDSKKNE